MVSPVRIPQPQEAVQPAPGKRHEGGIRLRRQLYPPYTDDIVGIRASGIFLEPLE